MTSIEFAFIVVLSVLVIAGLALFLWQRKKRGTGAGSTPEDLQHSNPDQEGGSSNNRKFLSSPGFALLFTGMIAVLTNYLAYVLKPFGSRGLCMCPAVPAGLLGILGGVLWYLVRRKKTGFAWLDLIPYTLIGFGAGMISYFFVDLIALVLYLIIGGQ